MLPVYTVQFVPYIAILQHTFITIVSSYSMNTVCQRNEEETGMEEREEKGWEWNVGWRGRERAKEGWEEKGR